MNYINNDSVTALNTMTVSILEASERMGKLNLNDELLLSRSKTLVKLKPYANYGHWGILDLAIEKSDSDLYEICLDFGPKTTISQAYDILYDEVQLLMESEVKRIMKIKS